MNAAQRAALLNPKQAKSMSSSSHSQDYIPPQINLQPQQGDVIMQNYPLNTDGTPIYNNNPSYYEYPHNFNNPSLATMTGYDSIGNEDFSTNDLYYDSPLYAPSLLNTRFPQNNSSVDDFLAEDRARAAKSASNNTGVPGYDPDQSSNNKAKRSHDAIESHANNADENVGSGSGQGSLLMRQYNVSEREYVPQKRQKSVASDEAKNEERKSKFSGGKTSGILGEYIKKKGDEGAAEAGPSGIVDLTADGDDDDDEIQIIKDIRISGNGQDPEREVCMGMIRALIMADMVPAAPTSALTKISSGWPACKMSLKPLSGAGIVVDAYDGRNQPFGKLDIKTARALAPLLKASNMSKLRVVSVLSERPRDNGAEQPGQPISELLECRLTLYAPASRIEMIGKLLSQHEIWLSRPLMVEMGREIINPHVPTYRYIPKSGSGTSRSAQVGYKERTTEEIKQDVFGMFDRLIRSEELPEMEADTSLVKTELMAHQKQALYFLTKQETPVAADEPPSNLWKPSIKKDGTKTWYNVISGHELKGVHLSLGGIFADMMGLGKTLSILSRVCASIKEARKFGKSELPEELQDHPSVERNTKGTLIVCPKSVLSNWDEQIKAHLNDKKMSFYVYHGPKRLQDIDELGTYDIVITSYTTVGSEFTSKSINYAAISKLNWYRVVLDEAHMIRNQDTNVFKAACKIVSQFRWAVTGTPIQNRLDDLGALIRFLKIYPFYQKGSFEQNFLAPFKAGDPQVISNLHLLVGSMTLRRSKDKIELPDKVEILTSLDFSDSEKALYEAFAKDAHRKLNAMVGQGSRLKGKGYAHVLVNIMRLRLICAHGRELLSEEDLKLLAGTSWDTAIDLGTEDNLKDPAMTEDQVYDTFYILRESNMDMCARCNETIGKATESDDYDEETSDNDIIGYMTPCLHTICPRCIEDYRCDLAGSQTRDEYARCPHCDQYNKAVQPPIRQSGVDADLARRQMKKLQPTKKGGQYSGPSTKVKALVEDLLRFKEESKELVELGEAPIRSVVFSGWTQYLDLIEIALNDNEIPFVRLDGRMSVAQRSSVMERFKSDASILVMLVSIKAGGQGLNFTTANKVFMMEPQFNPGVEQQAVDRVHRLGQKRNVTIKRFIMADSFEAKIVELQQKKLELASLAHDGGGAKGGDKESMQQKMEGLRSLFR